MTCRLDAYATPHRNAPAQSPAEKEDERLPRSSSLMFNSCWSGDKISPKSCANARSNRLFTESISCCGKPQRVCRRHALSKTRQSEKAPLVSSHSHLVGASVDKEQLPIDSAQVSHLFIVFIVFGDRSDFLAFWESWLVRFWSRDRSFLLRSRLSSELSNLERRHLEEMERREGKERRAKRKIDSASSKGNGGDQLAKAST